MIDSVEDQQAKLREKFCGHMYVTCTHTDTYFGQEFPMVASQV